MKTSEVLVFVKERFKDAIIKETVFRGETTIEVRKVELIELLTDLKKKPSLGFEVLMDLTGVDYIEPTPGTRIIYWLHNPNNYERLRITLFAQRDERVPSVVHLWEGADWYERELYDLFGVPFDGHPDLKRILLPDDWKGHPLRKDYPLTEEPVEFKHGVKPKVPSEIIHIGRKQKNIHE